MTNSIAPTSLSSPPKQSTTMICRKGEEKEFDSPKTTQTDVSSTYDEHSPLTPTPMTSRLGRIIISSCSSSTDSSSSSSTSTSITSDDIENGDDGSRTNSHRRRNMRRSCSINRPEFNKEMDDQSEAFISALNQLHRLATLDSDEYQQRLLENTLPTLPTETPNPLQFPSLAKAPASAQLSQLSQPIQTPLVQLSMSIHRLHAAVANITRDVDGHSEEVHDLQSQLAKLRRRNQQVESAAKKVHTKNLKLKQQASRDHKMVKGLQHKVHKYEAQLESQGLQLMASKVQQHEIQLQMSKSQHTYRAEGEGGRMRDRADSNVSEFLDDIEQESQYDMNSESVQTTEADLPTKHGNHHIRVDSFISIRSDLSERTGETKKVAGDCDVPPSPRETSVKSHSVFNDTLPTLRFSAEGMIKADRKSISSCEQGPSSKSIKTASSVDEVEVEVEVDHRKSESSQKETPVSHKEQQPKAEKSMSFSNRFAKFMAPLKVQNNYNLKMVSPCNIQFAVLPLSALAKESNNERRSFGNTDAVEDHGIVSMNDASSRSLDVGLSPDSQKLPSAFAVCGFDGFNTAINMKPTVGARLIKINGKMVDEEWRLETLYNELEEVSGKMNRGRQIVLAFRNEVWDSAQTEILNAAVQQVGSNDASVNSKSSNRGGKEKSDGQSLFKSQPRANSFGGSESDEETSTTKDPLPRGRTSSTDGLGMAISGIGNFLHNLNPSEGGR